MSPRRKLPSYLEWKASGVDISFPAEEQNNEGREENDQSVVNIPGRKLQCGIIKSKDTNMKSQAVQKTKKRRKTKTITNCSEGKLLTCLERQKLKRQKWSLKLERKHNLLTWSKSCTKDVM